jgi:hypothetical protein
MRPPRANVVGNRIFNIVVVFANCARRHWFLLGLILAPAAIGSDILPSQLRKQVSTECTVLWWLAKRSPDLHSAIDDYVDAGNVGAVV